LMLRYKARGRAHLRMKRLPNSI